MMATLRMRIILALGVWGVAGCLLAPEAVAQRRFGGGFRGPDGAEGDEATTITLNLNNVQIQQLVRFLSETTGKPVITQRNLDVQINLASPTPVTKRRALELIYDALQMEGIYVVELDDQLQIVRGDAIKGLRVRSIEDEEDLQALPDSLSIGQRIYKLKNVNAADLRNHLQRIVPESAMTLDPKTNTLILTDQIIRLKQFDRLIQALDSGDIADRVIEIFKLQHADALELANLIGNILMETSPEAASPQSGAMSFAAMRDLQRLTASRSSGRERGVSTPILVGSVTLVPDPRMNWLIASTPRNQLAEIARLVAEFDQPEDLDVRVRPMPVRHVEVSTVANVVSQLFRETAGAAAKDVIRAVPADDGNSLFVLSSKLNYDRIAELVRQMDTEDAEKREARTFTIRHLEAQDLAQQLTDLFNATAGRGTGSMYSYTYVYGGSYSADTGVRPTFVPSPRTNTLLVLARPRDFPFIEKMIQELDSAVDTEAFQPRIYRIRHTDANEMVKVLETIFQGQTSGTRTTQDVFWRPVGGTTQRQSLEAMFGQLRFVVDNVTNTIVVLASNPRNYEVIDSLIAELDKVDPESTEVLVYALNHADAVDIADYLNNLFSDAAVQRGGQAGRGDQQNQTQEQGQDQATQVAAAVVREIVYPWQSGQTGARRTQEEERPINTMIGNVRVVPDTRSNKIMVAAPPIYFPALRTVIQQLDQPEPQVLISTRIVEIQRGQDRRIGLRWTPNPNAVDPAELENAVLGLARLGFLDAGGGSATGSSRVVSESTPATDIGGLARTVTQDVEGGNALLGVDVNLGLLLQLLTKNTESRIISEPRITVNNNQMGRIFIGSEFPFRTDSQTTDRGSVTFGIEYREVGINLDVTPHINPEGQVVLTTRLENSKIRDGEFIDGQVIKDKREFTTELVVDSGQTMVIGGILLEDDSSIRRGVPLLSDIPIVKWLFTKSDRARSVRELLVFITPEILGGRQAEDALLKRARERLESLGAGDAFPEPMVREGEGS